VVVALSGGLVAESGGGDSIRSFPFARDLWSAVVSCSLTWEAVGGLAVLVVSGAGEVSYQWSRVVWPNFRGRGSGGS